MINKVSELRATSFEIDVNGATYAIDEDGDWHVLKDMGGFHTWMNIADDPLRLELNKSLTRVLDTAGLYIECSNKVVLYRKYIR